MRQQYEVVCSKPIWTDGVIERRALTAPLVEPPMQVEFICLADDPDDLDAQVRIALGVLVQMGYAPVGRA